MCKSWLLLKNILLRKKRPKYANWHFFWHNLSQSTKTGQPGNRDIKDEWQEISMFPRMDAICKNAHHISLVENRLKSQDNCTKPQLFAIRRQATSVIPQNMAKQDVLPHLSCQRNAGKSIRCQCARPVPAMFAATKSCFFYKWDRVYIVKRSFAREPKRFKGQWNWYILKTFRRRRKTENEQAREPEDFEWVAKKLASDRGRRAVYLIDIDGPPPKPSQWWVPISWRLVRIIKASIFYSLLYVLLFIYLP